MWLQPPVAASAAAMAAERSAARLAARSAAVRIKPLGLAAKRSVTADDALPSRLPGTITVTRLTSPTVPAGPSRC